MAKWCPIKERASAAAAVQAAVNAATSSAQYLQQPISPQYLQDPNSPNSPLTPSVPGGLPRVPSRQESLDSDFPEELELSETGRPGVLTYMAAALQNSVQDSAQISFGAFKSLLRAFQKASPAAPPVNPVSTVVSSNVTDSVPTSPVELSLDGDQNLDQFQTSAAAEDISPGQDQSPASSSARLQHGSAEKPALAGLGLQSNGMWHQANRWDSDAVHSGQSQAQDVTQSNITGSAAHDGVGSNALSESALQEVKAYGCAIGAAEPPSGRDTQTATTSTAHHSQQLLNSQAANGRLKHQTSAGDTNSSEAPPTPGRSPDAVAKSSQAGHTDVQQLELQATSLQLPEAHGFAADTDVDRGVDGSLEKELTGRPAALIADEALCNVANAAVADTGMGQLLCIGLMKHFSVGCCKAILGQKC